MSSNIPPHRRQAIIAAVTGAVAAMATAQTPPPPVASKDGASEPVDYWTPERMRDAKPIPLPAPPADGQPANGPEAANGDQQTSPSDER